MDIGIALDGEGRLGQLAVVTTLVQAADRLGYGSVWCIGPQAGALAVVAASSTRRVRIGLEGSSAEVAEQVRASVGGRLVVADQLPRWPQAASAPVEGRTPPTAGTYRLDVALDRLEAAMGELKAARHLDVHEIVVRLVGDPGMDVALAAYAELGELVEAPVGGLELNGPLPCQGSPSQPLGPARPPRLHRCSATPRLPRAGADVAGRLPAGLGEVRSRKEGGREGVALAPLGVVEGVARGALARLEITGDTSALAADGEHQGGAGADPAHG